MASIFRKQQIRGLHKLGDTYFPDFSATASEQHLDDLLAAEGRWERIGINVLLFLLLICPKRALRALLRCESPTVSPAYYAAFGKLHMALKALCAVLYYTKNDPRTVRSASEGDRVPEVV
jgi:hypothetical protein